LASGSPRRRAFLSELGASYTVKAADVDETPLPGEQPAALAARLAESKARAVAARQGDVDALVIAADTVVALGDTVLGKPVDDAEATAMLRQLRDRPHQVITTVCVCDCRTGRATLRVNTTTVVMRDYSDAEIAAYVATGDPVDKAGAYAIQHPVFAPAASIDGCLSTVVGLPLGDLSDLLAEHGVQVAGSVVAVCEQQTHFPCCRRPNTVEYGPN
jgi:septum formation protein